MQLGASTVGILIPAHNEAAMIAACVQSCLAQSVPADQIIVVNDGSTDATSAILKQFGDQIEVITVPTATGNKSHAQELGLQALTTEIVTATDGDTMLDPEFVRHIKDDFTDPEVMAVAGYVKSMRTNVLTALRDIEYVVGQDLFKRAQALIRYVLVIPGCAAAFRSELFRDGTLIFEHDTLTEDLDLTYKLHHHGHLIHFNTNAIVYTQDPPTLHSYINQMRRWYAGGWQNLLKHRRVFAYPNASLYLTLSYCEAFLFAWFVFLLPLVNFYAFGAVLIFGLITVLIMGAYAAWRRRRLELFLYSPLMLGMQYINSYVFLERFFTEIVFRRRLMHWFKAERRAVVPSHI